MPTTCPRTDADVVPILETASAPLPEIGRAVGLLPGLPCADLKRNRLGLVLPHVTQVC